MRHRRANPPAWLRDTGPVVVSKRIAWFLVGFALWSWVIWPVFLKNIWNDSRSWHHGMTGFFAVHLVLTAVSLAFGTAIGIIGLRGLRAAGSRSMPGVAEYR